MGMLVMEKTETVKRVVLTCDECGKRIKSNRRCCLCKKMLCETHTVYDDRDHGDYPDKYCASCWDAGENFRIEMKRLEDEYDKKLDALQDAWTDAALAEVKCQQS